jgi:hypothetical protein
MPVPHDVLLRELRKEFRKGGIHEASLRAKGWHLDGLCNHENGAVYVDPAPHVTETLLHEVLHRRFPRWGERRVEATANRLLRSMNSRQVRWWYRAFQKSKTTLTTPVSADI